MYQSTPVSIYSEYYVIFWLLLFLMLTSFLFLPYDVQNTEYHGDKSF